MYYRITQDVRNKFYLYLIFLPSKRTIFCYDHAGKNRAYFLQFPTLLFKLSGEMPAEYPFKFNYLYLYFVKNNQCFIPPLTNAYGSEICLGREIETAFVSLGDMATSIINCFWQFPFTLADLGNISKYLKLHGNISKYLKLHSNDSLYQPPDVHFILNKWKNDPQSILGNLLHGGGPDCVAPSDIDLSNYKKISSLKEIYYEI